jgi:uncharacterized protein (TIGR03437 family)
LPGGSHFVVATGTNADGSVRIFDPNPNLGRTNLTEYLNGFLSDGWQYQGTIVAAIRLVPKAPLPGGFFAWGSAAMTAGSSAGACATSFQWPATAMPAPLLNADILGQQAAPIRFVACSPGQTTYQLELSGAGQATLSDTNSPTQASRIESSGPPATYKLTRPGTPQWLVAPMDVAVAAGGVVNAASFTPSFAPGGLISIFGNGLARAGFATSVLVGNEAATVVFASPFQVNAQVPSTLFAGATTLRLTTPFGAVEQRLSLDAAAPALFTLTGNQGAVLNQDGTVNGPTNPERRGRALVAFGTGLGRTRVQGALQVTEVPVTATVAGVATEVFFAGLTPGFVGLYQVNLLLPNDLPPGLAVPLAVRQGAAAANAVEVAVQ